MRPEVSILMPVYNGEQYLHQAAESILNQTFNRFEVIAVNDGSTDRTGFILDEYRTKDPRFKIYNFPENKGIIEALNFGLNQSKTSIIARMDADDIMHPDRLKLQFEFLRDNPRTDLVSCLVKKISPAKVLDGYKKYIRWLNSVTDHETICRDIFVESPLAHPSVMFRKQSVIDCGGYKEFGWAEDYDLWIRMYLAGKKFAKVKETLLSWRDIPDRLSRTDNRYSLQNFHRCKSYYLSNFILKDRKKVVVWGAKRQTRKFSDTLREYGIDIIAYVDVDRKKIGNIVNEVPVIAPDSLKDFISYPVLSYVSKNGARHEIRNHLLDAGYIEGKTFFMMA